MRVVWACQDCGYEWPLPPGLDETCPECGGEHEKVDPVLVVFIDLLESIHQNMLQVSLEKNLRIDPETWF